MVGDCGAVIPQDLSLLCEAGAGGAGAARAEPLPSPRWQCTGAKNQERGEQLNERCGAGGVNDLSSVNSCELASCPSSAGVTAQEPISAGLGEIDQRGQRAQGEMLLCCRAMARAGGSGPQLRTVALPPWLCWLPMGCTRAKNRVSVVPFAFHNCNSRQT